MGDLTLLREEVLRDASLRTHHLASLHAHHLACHAAYSLGLSKACGCQLRVVLHMNYAAGGGHGQAAVAVVREARGSHLNRDGARGLAVSQAARVLLQLQLRHLLELLALLHLLVSDEGSLVELELLGRHIEVPVADFYEVALKLVDVV